MNNTCEKFTKDPNGTGCFYCSKPQEDHIEGVIEVKGQEGEGTPHEIIKGLTSIIMPIYLTDYSLFHYTGNAIGSVREHTDPQKTPYELIVVDDGSPITHQSPQMYYADKYTKNEENQGVTKSWNKGIRISQGEYIVLLNNDTMVFDGWLEDLQECLEHKDLVMATPMYGEAFARATEAAKKREQWKEKMIGESFSDFKDFSCVIAKRDLFNELGLFDERFKTYAQDSDFLRTMEEAGKKYASTKRVPIFHIIGATATTQPDNAQQMNEDKKQYDEKWNKVQVSEVVNPTPSIMEDYPEAPHTISQPKSTFSLEGIVSPEDLAPVEEVVQTLDAKGEAKFVRTPETGDKVYLVKNDKLHWVTGPLVFDALEGKFENVVTEDRTIFSKYELGDPITMQNIEEYK